MVDQKAMEEMIELWEPAGCEVVRTIDSMDDTVERIVKVGEEYHLYRYFTLGSDDRAVFVSVDLQAVDGDRIIQELAERL